MWNYSRLTGEMLLEHDYNNGAIFPITRVLEHKYRLTEKSTSYSWQSLL